MANAGSRARFVLLLTVVLLLQVSVMAQLTFLDVVVDLLAVTAVAGGMNGGAERGVVIGFAAGLMSDLLVHTPFGLVTIVLTFIGFAAGALVGPISQAGPIMRALIAGGLSTGAVLVFVTASWLLDLTYVVESGVARIALINGVVTILLYPVAENAVRWALLIRRNLRDIRVT